ncbi:MAG: hypothetical protein M0Z52_02950 [Actinomycetota bacterium]|nr:hypothetical protein [Actinomycetota bacterium]
MNTEKPSGWRAALAVFSAYSLLSVAMTWPVVLHFTNYTMGDGMDDQQFLWNYWWVKHAIVDLKTNPFFTDYMFYPHKNGLALHTLLFLNGLFSIPLQYFLTLPAIYNLFVLLSFALSGLGAFLLARRFVKDWKAAFAAGLIFASYRCVYIRIGWANICSAQWVPFYLLFLLKALDKDSGRLKFSIFAGIFLVFNFFSDYYHFLACCIFTLIILVFYWASKALRPAELAKRFLPVVLVCVPFISPVIYWALREGAAGQGLGNISWKSTGIAKNVADIAGFISPHPANPFLGRLSLSKYFTGEWNYCYLGAAAIVFSVYAFLQHRKSRGKIADGPLRREKLELMLWGISAAAFMILAMGPYPHFFGKQIPVPLPFKLFELSGFLSGLRAPDRFSIYAVLAVAMPASIGMQRAFAKKKFLFALVIPVILVEYTTAPYPLYNCTIPPVYNTMAADKQAQSILEIPVFLQYGIAHSGYPADYVLYYQTFHGKKLFNGYLSRVPDATIYSYFNLPIYRSLLEIEYLESNGQALRLAMQTDRQVAPSFINLFGVGYVVVHRMPFAQTRAAMDVDAMERYLNNVLPMSKIYDDGVLAVYKTQMAKQKDVTVYAATNASVLYLYKGWVNGLSEGGYGYAMCAAKKSVLLANLRRATGYEMDIDLSPATGIKDTRVEVGVNGKKIGSLHLKDGWNTYEIDIPASMPGQGLNRIYFKPAETARPAMPFKGIWPAFAISRSVPDYPLDWEQDNSKFGRPGISFALHRFEIKEKHE